MQRIGLIILLAFAPMLAQAQTYKWVDQSGSTQYSDRPPAPGVKFEQIDKGAAPGTAPDAPAATPAAGNNPRAGEFEFRKRQLAAEEKQKEDEQKEKDAKAKQENCDIAQARLRRLEDGGRIIKSNANGEREYMGDEEIETEKIQAQKRVADICK